MLTPHMVPDMTSTIESIRAEFLRCKALAEAAIAQVEEADRSGLQPEDGAAERDGRQRAALAEERVAPRECPCFVAGGR